jgi:DNA-binding CsgD family transcriptional regulator
MSWATYPDRAIAERVCTPKELEVLKYKALGYGRRRGSLVLGISTDAWRDRQANALRKIAAAKRQEPTT